MKIGWILSGTGASPVQRKMKLHGRGARATLVAAAAVFSLAVGAISVCARGDEPSKVHSIELPHYLPYLPDGADRELFASRCLSCHSTRYITMQPVVPVAKWEESVKKMIKTYGAPIAEDEVARIAQYCVTMQQAMETTGPDPLARTMAQAFAMPELPGGDVERGRQVFAAACASCHGADGKGVGINQSTLLPHAFDLTDGRYAPAAVATAVVQGVRGTAMPAFSSMPDQSLADVVAFTVSLGAAAKTASDVPAPEATKALFATACASCHGAEGKGDGLNAPVLPRKPTNFQLRQPSQARAVSAISEGVPGTSMPSWKAKLDDAQRAALAEYVRSLYVEPGH